MEKDEKILDVVIQSVSDDIGSLAKEMRKDNVIHNLEKIELIIKYSRLYLEHAENPEGVRDYILNLNSLKGKKEFIRENEKASINDKKEKNHADNKLEEKNQEQEILPPKKELVSEETEEELKSVKSQKEELKKTSDKTVEQQSRTEEKEVTSINAAYEMYKSNGFRRTENGGYIGTERIPENVVQANNIVHGDIVSIISRNPFTLRKVSHYDEAPVDFVIFEKGIVEIDEKTTAKVIKTNLDDEALRFGRKKENREYFIPSGLSDHIKPGQLVDLFIGQNGEGYPKVIWRYPLADSTRMIREAQRKKRAEDKTNKTKGTLISQAKKPDFISKPVEVKEEEISNEIVSTLNPDKAKYDFKGKTVLVVGMKMYQGELRRMFRDNNARLSCFDAKTNVRSRMKSAVSRSDVVIIALSHTSHAQSSAAVDYAKMLNKPYASIKGYGKEQTLDQAWKKIKKDSE